jgi:tRNA threonylcarbamoyladenosine biosynthesis protein TsaB
VRLAALETATAVTAIAVGEDDDVVERVVDDARRHVEVLVPALGEALGARGWGVSTLDAVVVDVGPGLFTGLRVGVATARALALSAGVGLVATTSTDALAEAARDRGLRGDVAAVVDVRRGEVAWAAYRLSDDGAVAVSSPALARPDALAAGLSSHGPRPVAVGDGAWRYRDVLAASHVDVVDDLAVPSPGAALRLARRRLSSGEAALAHDALHPLYLREADATVNFAVRGTTP